MASPKKQKMAKEYFDTEPRDGWFPLCVSMRLYIDSLSKAAKKVEQERSEELEPLLRRYNEVLLTGSTQSDYAKRLLDAIDSIPSDSEALILREPFCDDVKQEGINSSVVVYINPEIVNEDPSKDFDERNRRGNEILAGAKSSFDLLVAFILERFVGNLNERTKKEMGRLGIVVPEDAGKHYSAKITFDKEKLMTLEEPRVELKALFDFYGFTINCAQYLHIYHYKDKKTGCNGVQVCGLRGLIEAFSTERCPKHCFSMSIDFILVDKKE